MSAWLDPLRRALDSAPAPSTFFFRDDDVGWDDQRLFALLELCARYDAPLDLAVVISVLRHVQAIALSQGEFVAETVLAEAVAALDARPRPRRGLQEEPRYFDRDSTSRHSMACIG